MTDTIDAAFMARALELARGGWGQVAPNPLVGAVVVQGAEVVGEGYHARFGEPHAEPVALGAAGARARGATMYVSLEPCAHQGKTPPCTEAIVRAGVRRVVIATRDPNPLAAGGADRLRAAGIEVTVGVREGEARELNAPFCFAQQGSRRPWVTLKLAVSLDGAIADATHTTSRVTGEAAQRHAHWLRAGHDAVAVGMATVRIDDPQLTVRHVGPPRIPPARVVFSRGGRLSPASTLANSLKQGPVIVAAEEVDPQYAHELQVAGVELVHGSTLGEMLEALGSRGIRSLLVEGGAVIAGALLDAGLVDRLILIQAPTAFGGGALGAFSALTPRRAADAPRWRVVAREVLGDDLATTYAIREV